MVLEVQFLKERKKINVEAFDTLCIGLTSHLRITFEERVSRRNRTSENVTFSLTFREGDLGYVQRYSCEFANILAWNRDGN